MHIHKKHKSRIGADESEPRMPQKRQAFATWEIITGSATHNLFVPLLLGGLEPSENSKNR